MIPAHLLVLETMTMIAVTAICPLARMMKMKTKDTANSERWQQPELRESGLRAFSGGAIVIMTLMALSIPTWTKSTRTRNRATVGGEANSSS